LVNSVAQPFWSIGGKVGAATALEVILELPDNVIWEIPALHRQHVLEPRPVLLDQLIKKRVLWLMSGC
jgi:hypothetical protein